MKPLEDKVLQAREAALKLLAGRDLTRGELIERLIARRTSAIVAEAAVLQLEELGLVDDRRTAAEHVRRRLEAGHVARTLLETELLERGLDHGLVAAVLHDALGGLDEENEALELARDKVRRSPARLTPIDIRRRTFAFLVRRGFDEEIARQAVETAAEEYLGRP
jgi:SOS response regulatory protein OraA/RecX